ncbi:FMN-binding protein [Bacillaceae bacterium S4-13-58]
MVNSFLVEKMVEKDESNLNHTLYYNRHGVKMQDQLSRFMKTTWLLKNQVTGKTISELEDVLADNSAEEMVDVVSGATHAFYFPSNRSSCAFSMHCIGSP